MQPTSAVHKKEATFDIRLNMTTIQTMFFLHSCVRTPVGLVLHS